MQIPTLTTKIQPLPLTGLSFDAEVLDSSQPVLIGFTTDGCATCRKADQICDDLAESFDGLAKITRVDVVTEPDLTERLGVGTLPSLMLFHRGRLVEHWIGTLPKSDLEAALCARLPAA